MQTPFLTLIITSSFYSSTSQHDHALKMLLKSTLLAAVLGLTLSQPVLGEWTKGASVELGEKDGKCTFHVKDYPRKGCSGTQTKADIEDHEKDIGKVKDGKCNGE